MAEKLVLQSNVRYLVRFLRDDCTPFTGKFGIDYSFYVSATYRHPENDQEVTQAACTLWLPAKEAIALAEAGAGKGAVVALIRKESLSDGGKRTYQWSLTVQTAPEKPGFEIVEFGTKARVGRLGAPAVTGAVTADPNPSTPQEEKPMLAPPRGRGIDYHKKLYAHCLAASIELWRDFVEELSLPAVGATASTLYIQMLREGPPNLEGAGPPKPKVAIDPSDLPF